MDEEVLERHLALLEERLARRLTVELRTAVVLESDALKRDLQADLRASRSDVLATVSLEAVRINDRALSIAMWLWLALLLLQLVLIALF